jgi:hypothetical protein
MDLWKALGGKPPEKAFTGILAEAHSNQPKLGTGADAFARARHDRISPAQVVARTAFSCMASSSSGQGGYPGFDVRIDCPATQGGHRSLAGRARITGWRTGEVTTLSFAASHDGLADFECRVDGRRLGLDDLDEEAAQALRFGALVRMAAPAGGATGCRALLEVADKLSACTANEHAALSGLLARALASYLEDGLGTRGPMDWQLALRLADRAGAVQTTDDWRRVQEVVWEHLDSLRRRRESPQKPLRALAERLSLLKAAE